MKSNENFTHFKLTFQGPNKLKNIDHESYIHWTVESTPITTLSILQEVIRV